MLLLALGALVGCTPAASQDRDPDEGPIDAWARAVAEATMPRWAGPRVRLAPSRPRPGLPVAARSTWAPVAVHADPDVDPARVDRALTALEEAHATLARAGWGASLPDGGRGDSDGFDLYLRTVLLPSPPGSFDQPEAVAGEDAAAPDRSIAIGWDVQVDTLALDAVTAFAELDAGAEALEACVIDAYAQALVAEQDPAEAPAWRRAVGAFLAFELTGEYGCAGPALAWAQARPERGLVVHAPGSGEAGALLLALLSARHDAGTGDFVRDVVQGARQWTWEGEGLRADPNVWHALELILERAHHPLPTALGELAVARYFAGSRAALGTAIPALREAPGEVPAPAAVRWAELPRTLVRGEPAVGAGGTVYARVEVLGAPAGAVLRVWLRAEFGTGWSLVACRLDAAGRLLGTMSAPVRREPRSYLPVELDGATATVLLAVTNTGDRRPVADSADPTVRSFLLTADRGP